MTLALVVVQDQNAMEMVEVTPDQFKAFYLRLQDGMHRGDAAGMVGIPPRDITRWIQAGEGDTPKEEERRLIELVREAEGKAIQAALNKIRKMGRNWQREAWWLSRRFPDVWGDKPNAAKASREVQIVDLTDEEDETREDPAGPPRLVEEGEREVG